MPKGGIPKIRGLAMDTIPIVTNLSPIVSEDKRNNKRYVSSAILNFCVEIVLNEGTPMKYLI